MVGNSAACEHHLTSPIVDVRVRRHERHRRRACGAEAPPRNTARHWPTPKRPSMSDDARRALVEVAATHGQCLQFLPTRRRHERHPPMVSGLRSRSRAARRNHRELGPHRRLLDPSLGADCGDAAFRHYRRPSLRLSRLSQVLFHLNVFAATWTIASSTCTATWIPVCTAAWGVHRRLPRAIPATMQSHSTD